MPLILPSNSISAGGYEVDNSLRFNSGSSDYLSRTYGTPTNNLKYTKSFWVKRSALTDIGKGFIWCSSTNSNTDFFYFNASDQIVLGNVITPNTATAVFRDVSAWYHCVMVFDSANATADDRLILYVNGIRQTLSSTISLNSTGGNQSGVTYTIANQGGISRYLDGYLAEICMIDGQALDPTSFGEFDADTGMWKPIDVSGLTFGNNGYYLDFENSGSLGADVSGNGNNFTVNNLTSIDQTTDTPTNNFATLNPLIGNTSSTFSEGNLRGTIPPINGSVVANIAVNSGKWYCEFKFNTIVGYVVVGLSDMSKKGFNTTQESNPQASYYASDPGTFAEIGTLFTKGTQSGTSFITTAGNVYGLMWDADNSILKITDGTNTFQSEFTVNDPSVPISFMFAVSSGAGNGDVSVNFGNPPFTISSGNSDANGYGNFEYTVPSGYYALCTKNLAEFG